MTAFYNEIDPYCAAWLRNLIAAGHIAPGIVDERSIEDIAPDELREYTQCHFFAGVGVWSHALRLAGWPDDRPVWTGSCPCQPFSQAGKGAGFADERHLWPAWFHLIRECRPSIVFGEQVASPDGLAWLDLVHADLEGARYAIGVADLCAAGVGAPHIRQRLYFLGRANADVPNSFRGWSPSWQQPIRHADSSFVGVALGNANDQRLEGRRLSAERARELLAGSPSLGGNWSGADWLECWTEELGTHYRPVEPGTFPLAHGIANRMDKLRAYGNAIVAPLAAEFVGAYLDTMSVEQQAAA